MTQDPIAVTVVVGSTRAGRLAPGVTAWFADQLAQREDMIADVVDVSETALPDNLDPNHPHVVALRPRLAAADAFVFVVPEYNRGIPGPLKTLIDTYNSEWEAKPVGFVAYGLSISGGVRAVEHLRQIFSEFHSVGMKDIVCFPRILDHLGAEGTFAPASPASSAAAKTLLDQLHWWAQTLRDAKRLRPYRS